MADVVVQPRSEEEIAAVVAAAVRHRIPLTIRGGGTGNYGQSVPLKGGVLVDMTGFNKVSRWSPAAFACKPAPLLAQRSKRLWRRASN